MSRSRREKRTARPSRAIDPAAGSFDEQLDRYRAGARQLTARGRQSGWTNRPGSWLVFTSAAGAATAMAGAAEASVIYSGPQNLAVGPVPAVSSAVSSLQLDLDGDSVDDVRARAFRFYFGEFRGGDLQGLGTDVFVAREGAVAKNFTTGSTIGGSANFANPNAQIFGWTNPVFNSAMGWPSSGATGLAGVDLHGHYGWIRVEVVSPDEMQIVDWAFESVAGSPIAAGATGITIPEPSAGALTGLGLLALGSAGVRRRRKH